VLEGYATTAMLHSVTMICLEALLFGGTAAMEGIILRPSIVDIIIINHAAARINVRTVNHLCYLHAAISLFIFSMSPLATPPVDGASSSSQVTVCPL
jgi:hypothetical protein